jgi:ubiquitin-large subunit ribosomal protein L40e
MAAADRPITAVVRTLVNATEMEIGTANSTIAEVMEVIEAELGIAKEAQRLIFAGMQLERERTVNDYNIQNEATIYVVARLVNLQVQMSLLDGQEPNRDGSLMSYSSGSDKKVIHTFVLGSEHVLELTAGEVAAYCCGFPRVMSAVPVSVTSWELRRGYWGESDERAGDLVDFSVPVRDLLAELDEGGTPAASLLLQPSMSSAIKSVHKR